MKSFISEASTLGKPTDKTHEDHLPKNPLSIPWTNPIKLPFSFTHQKFPNEEKNFKKLSRKPRRNIDLYKPINNKQEKKRKKLTPLQRFFQEEKRKERKLLFFFFVGALRRRELWGRWRE